MSSLECISHKRINAFFLNAVQMHCGLFLKHLATKWQKLTIHKIRRKNIDSNKSKCKVGTAALETRSFQPRSPAKGLAVGNTLWVFVINEVTWVLTRLVEVIVVKVS